MTRPHVTLEDFARMRREPPRRPPFASNLVRGYYFLTPAFILLDYAFGVNLRLAPVVPPHLKILYYAVCLGMAAWMLWKPAWAHLAALMECSLNILLLILSLFGPFYQFLNTVGEPGTEAPPLTPGMGIDFILAGIVWTVAFYANPLLSPPRSLRR